MRRRGARVKNLRISRSEMRELLTLAPRSSAGFSLNVLKVQGLVYRPLKNFRGFGIFLRQSRWPGLLRACKPGNILLRGCLMPMFTCLFTCTFLGGLHFLVCCSCSSWLRNCQNSVVFFWLVSFLHFTQCVGMRCAQLFVCLIAFFLHFDFLCALT